MRNYYFDNDNLNEYSIHFWTIPGKIVKDRNYLSNKTLPVDDINLGEKIATKLLNTIGKHGRDAIGLSANQIGINRQVCVINVTSPLIFINPEIIETYTIDNSSTLINDIFIEGCLSFPGKYAHVKRAIGIKVNALNLSEPIIFGAIDEEDYNKKGLGHSNYPHMLECVTIQHEIDHLNGITMLDRNIISKPIIAKHKIGRNETVKIHKGDEFKIIKFKIFSKYQTEGWNLINDSDYLSGF